MITSADIPEIANVLKCEFEPRDGAWHGTIRPENGAKLAVTIHPDIREGENVTCLVSTFTGQTHLQLHRCTTFMINPALGEVVFLSRENDRVSGLIVSFQASASFYANVREANLSTPFEKLDPELVISSVALSVLEATEETG